MKKIKLLQDTRTEVRKLYGEPVLIEEDRDIFVLNNGKLAITYSYGECSAKDLWERWQVPKNVVLDVDFQLKQNVDFSSLKLKLSNFMKLIPDDTPQMKIYTSEKQGIEYTTFLNQLSSINIFPSKSQSSLKCKE